MKFHHSLKVAQHVLTELLSNDEFMKLDGYIESYQNGREQGYAIVFYQPINFAVYICEERRSDNIAVYRGSYSMQSISEDAYKNCRTFEEGSYEEAADFIVEETKRFLLAKIGK